MFLKLDLLYSNLICFLNFMIMIGLLGKVLIFI